MSPQKPATVDQVDSAGKEVADSQEPSSDEEDADDNLGLSTIPDEDEDETSHISSPVPRPLWQHSYTRHNSSDSSMFLHESEQSPTPSTESSVQNSASELGFMGHIDGVVSQNLSNQLDFSHLPHDLRFYLSFFLQEITYHHYSLKHDSSNFLASIVHVALTDESLLNAIVGFAAYQHSLRASTAKIQDFLMYYNKSVSLLLRTLRKNQPRTLGTLLTMLQLACIEVS